MARWWISQQCHVPHLPPGHAHLLPDSGWGHSPVRKGDHGHGEEVPHNWLFTPYNIKSFLAGIKWSLITSGNIISGLTTAGSTILLWALALFMLDYILLCLNVLGYLWIKTFRNDWIKEPRSWWSSTCMWGASFIGTSNWRTFSSTTSDSEQDEQRQQHNQKEAFNYREADDKEAVDNTPPWFRLQNSKTRLFQYHGPNYRVPQKQFPTLGNAKS